MTMAASIQSLLSSSSSSSLSCLALPSKLSALSLNPSTLSFSASLSSHSFVSRGSLSIGTVPMLKRQSLVVICEAAPAKKADSAAKRARQAEKRRVYNKARKSEIRTRMRKVLEALDALKKKPDAQSEEVIPIEKFIAEAYSAIDKAVKVGTLHRNTGANRKSRLARRKKAVEIHHGWYTPAPVPQPESA